MIPQQGDIVVLNTKGRKWRQVTIQPYHGLKAEVIQIKTDLMTVKLLDKKSFKRRHPTLSTDYVYMPIWAAERPDKQNIVMDVE